MPTLIIVDLQKQVTKRTTINSSLYQYTHGGVDKRTTRKCDLHFFHNYFFFVSPNGTTPHNELCFSGGHESRIIIEILQQHDPQARKKQRIFQGQRRTFGPFASESPRTRWRGDQAGLRTDRTLAQSHVVTFVFYESH